MSACGHPNHLLGSWVFLISCLGNDTIPDIVSSQLEILAIDHNRVIDWDLLPAIETETHD